MLSAPIALVVATSVVLGLGAATAAPARSEERDGPGSLTVVVADAPGDIATPVQIVGPGGFDVTAERTTVIRNLPRGTYTVTASVVPNPLGNLVPQLPDQKVYVDTNVHRGVAVAFRFDAPALGAAGDADAYAIQAGSATNPVRWNPCRTITWGPLLPLPLPEEQRLTSAFAKASIASGIPFRRTAPGETAMINVSLYFAPGAEVSGDGTMYYGAAIPDGPAMASHGDISAVIGTESSAELREALYLHEIGHVLGITHVADPSQVMHQEVSEADAAGFAVGDTNGLRLVGAQAGCLDPPVGAKDVRATVTDGTATLSWFQPASLPPVLTTYVHIATSSDNGRASSTLPWNGQFTGAGAGPMRATAEAPPSMCEDNAAVSLVSRNSHGYTVTPVTVAGC